MSIGFAEFPLLSVVLSATASHLPPLSIILLPPPNVDKL